MPHPLGQQHEHVLPDADHQHEQADTQPFLDLALGQPVFGTHFGFDLGNQGEQLVALGPQVVAPGHQRLGNLDLDQLAYLFLGAGFELA